MVKTDKKETNSKRNLNIDWIKLWYIISIAVSVLGVIIIIVFLYSLNHKYSINYEGDILLEKTGQVGDFVGGFVGSIWALVGVILLAITLHLQRKQFELQKSEIDGQKSDFKIDRITNILFKQLDQVDRAINPLKLKLESKAIDSRGLKTVQAFGTWNSWYLDRKNLNTLNSQETKELGVLGNFMLNSEVEHFLRKIFTCIKILNKLIDGENPKLSKNDSNFLYSLIYENFNLKDVKSFIKELNVQLEETLKMNKENNLPQKILTPLLDKQKFHMEILVIINEIESAIDL